MLVNKSTNISAQNDIFYNGKCPHAWNSREWLVPLVTESWLVCLKNMVERGINAGRFPELHTTKRSWMASWMLIMLSCTKLCAGGPHRGTKLSETASCSLLPQVRRLRTSIHSTLRHITMCRLIGYWCTTDSSPSRQLRCRSHKIDKTVFWL